MRKKIGCFICAAMILFGCTNVLGFTFPEPDWRKLLNEKKSMVNEVDFELYAEGNPSSAPYYGARLEPRSGTYLGMVTENANNFLPLGSYLTYVEGTTQNDLYYPANEMIESGNSVVMVGWNFSDMYNVDYNAAKSILDTLASYNKPMFIRIACEMNVSEIGNDPNKYLEVYRTLANLVHEYPNFAAVWSPNDLGGLDRDFSYYYPGDEFVDWVGVSCYSIKYFQGNQNTAEKDSIYFMTGDYAWTTNRLKPIINFMNQNGINKPVMISEGGVPTNNIFGEDCSQWSSPRLRNMLWYTAMKYPQIKMINYFNNHRSNESERFDLNGYSWAENIFTEASQSGIYLKDMYDAADFSFVPAANGETFTAKNGGINFYTLAHFPKQSDFQVHYYIDGEWKFAAGSIPYNYIMNTNELSDGYHTITIKSSGNEKSYGFYKRANAVCFTGEPELKITVNVNGEQVIFDQEPVIVNDRTLVPLRAIFEAIGAYVDWDDQTKTVKATKGDNVVTLQIGSNIMTVNGQERILDVPAQLISDRTMVPVRAIGEAFGNNVDWKSDTKTVEVY